MELHWIDVRERKPKCPRDENALGTHVLIWPRDERYATAFYGKRATGRPAFYVYGAEIHGVTHWASLPDGPKGGA
jgi:hypothetical protein